MVENEFTVQDSLSFSQEIIDVNFNGLMVSLDPEVLFANIPLGETID